MYKFQIILTWLAVAIVFIVLWIVFTSKKTVIIEPRPVIVDTSPIPFYPCLEGDKCNQSNQMTSTATPIKIEDYQYCEECHKPSPKGLRYDMDLPKKERKWRCNSCYFRRK